MPSPERPLRDVLPASFRSPGALVWAMLVPQALLLALNARSYTLVAGEMAPAQRELALALLAYECLLLGVGAAAAGLLRAARRPVPAWGAAALLLLHAGYLWMATPWIVGPLLPASVTTWILRPETVLYHQYALVMPALAYALTLLACLPSRLRAPADAGITLLAGFTAPAAWYLFTLFLRLLDYRPLRGVPTFAIFLLLALSTLVLVAALVRLAAGAAHGARRFGEPGRMVVAGFVGLVGPVAGLLLNARIAFPADFQAPSVYALAVTNGLLLLCPTPRRPAARTALWWLQAATFPFTLYFFVVFLPFLPLAILAVLAAGAGFLMLTPTALLFVHGRRVLEGIRDLAARRGRAAALGALVAALAVLPGAIAGRALADRATLHRAIRHAWSPDLAAPARFDGSPAALRRCLTRLRDWKAGVQLPFLSGFYQWAVFDGLSLPDAKLQHLQRLFLGAPLAGAKTGGPLAGLLPRDRLAAPRSRFAPARPPATTDVVLADTRVDLADDDGATRALVRLSIRNDAPAQREFVTELAVPPAAIVSGFWLHIGDERVPGRLFERKTALWVYETIRDVTRRDPGLLLYPGPGRVELRVFPMEARQTRTVEIEFLWPAGFDPGVRIGGAPLPAAPRAGPPAPPAVANTGGGPCVALDAGAAERLPAVRRAPYAHFVVDRSAAAADDLAVTLARARDLAGRWDLREARVTLANYDIEDLAPDPVPVERIGELAGRATLPARGGFGRDRAIEWVLRDAAARTAAGRLGDRAPFVVVLVAGQSEPLPDENLAWFAGLVPDAGGFRQVRPDGRVEDLGFDGAPWDGQPRPVLLFRCGDRVVAAARDAGADAVHLAATATRQVPEVYDPDASAFVPVADAAGMPAGSRYARGQSVWSAYLAAVRDPAGYGAALPALVAASRDAGVLIPATSYIVVENSAQWKVLERTERRKLAGEQAFELRETPEPSTWLLLGGLAVFAWLRARSRRRRAA